MFEFLEIFEISRISRDSRIQKISLRWQSHNNYNRSQQYPCCLFFFVSSTLWFEDMYHNNVPHYVGLPNVVYVPVCTISPSYHAQAPLSFTDLFSYVLSSHECVCTLLLFFSLLLLCRCVVFSLLSSSSFFFFFISLTHH